jgi:hypothetical protein
MSLVLSTAIIGNAITRQFNGFNVRVRESDGYIHATDMCKIGKKLWGDYYRSKRNIEFFGALSIDMGIPITELIQSKQGGDSRLQGTWVHPHIAINLSQWISPIFAVKVSGWIARFISGDLTLADELVENANINSGKINNITIKTDPNTGERLAFLQEFEKDNYQGHIDFLVHKENIKLLQDVINGVTNERDQFKQLLIDNKILTKQIFTTLNETKNSLDETKEVLINTNTKLDRVLPQRVETNKLETGERQQVLILHDSDAKGLEYNLYVLRVQQRKINPAISRIRNKYGNNIHRIYTIDQPNAVTFWNTIKTTLKGNIQKDLKTNWFILTDMTLTQFKDKLNELDCARQE